MSCPKALYREKIINKKIESIMNDHNHTWELMNLPLKNKSLGHKWIFRRKMKVNGSIDKYKARWNLMALLINIKARLVVKGFRWQ
jgi:hypothetical protein